MTSKTNVPTQYLKLTSEHKTIQKLEKIFDLLEEIGLSLDFCGPQTIVTDDEFPKISFYLSDVESNDGVQSFPPSCDYKVTRDNPLYQQFMLEKSEEERLVREEKERLQKLEREEKEKQKKIKEEERQKNNDLNEYERLKRKYNL